MRRDLHGSLTAAERNPDLASPRRRNYGSRRRQLLPLDQRIKRLRNHFAGVEHFAGAEYPPPKPFDLENNRFHLQMAVIECIHRQRLSVAQTAELLSTTEREIEFTLDIIKQNAE